MELSYEDYQKWSQIKAGLEARGLTNSPYYTQAIYYLSKRPMIAPYVKADAKISKDDII